MKINIIIYLSIAISLIACTNKKNNKNFKILPEDTMALIITDIHLTDATIAMLPQKEKKKSPGNFYLHIFKKYNTTKEIFDSSVSYYTTHSNKYKKIYENVLFKLSKKEGEILAEKDTASNTKIYQYKKVLSLNSNFESIKNNFLTDNVSRIKAKSGKQAILFNYKKKKSKDIVYKINQDINEFKIKFNCLISMLSNKTKTFPLLIVLVENNNKVIFKDEISFKDYISDKQEWNKINLNSKYKLPQKLSTGKIKIFIANPYKNDFFIDDYFLEIYVKQ